MRATPEQQLANQVTRLEMIEIRKDELFPKNYVEVYRKRFPEDEATYGVTLVDTLRNILHGKAVSPASIVENIRTMYEEIVMINDKLKVK